ncbi:MAG: proton-conducting transporter membrane subunit [Actinomycetales bacterium]
MAVLCPDGWSGAAPAPGATLVAAVAPAATLTPGSGIGLGWQGIGLGSQGIDSGFTAGVLAQVVAAAAIVVVAVAVPSPRARTVAAGTLSMLLGALGALTGATALAGDHGQLALGTALDGVTLTWAATPLGGVFTVVAGVVAVLASLFGIGYAHGPVASRTAWSAFAVFVLGMQLVPAAGDVVSFLLAWELMALGSTVLVLCEHGARAGVRPAGLWYATMTHLSFLLVAAGFALLAASAGSTSLAGIAEATLGGGTASAGFALLVIGFATKAGAVPLHVWLPRAHPEAPSHVSALMSAAMVKLGVYGVLLTTTVLLPAGPPWWALLVLALGLASALYGILQASVASDLKRLLAYSTSENVGLILTAIAVAMLTRTTRPGVAATALVAALLLTVSHAAFKTTLFLGAGSILHATGERDLDRMGGLAVRMPATTIALAVGCLGAAALPVSSGFVAEWSLLQALIHADGRIDRLTTALLPLMMGVVALTAGLALLTFTKAFGIATLARPRTQAAAQATESPLTMQVAVLAAAGCVLALGLLPGWVMRGLAAALPSDAVVIQGPSTLRLPGVSAGLDPAALTVLAALLTLPILLVVISLARRVPRRRVDLGWGCGGVRTSPRMQYTATSYAEPLVRVFDDALSPTTDVTVSHHQESAFTVRTMTYSQHLVDIVEERAYAPAVRLLNRIGDWARGIQNGDIHRYLAFSFAALLLVLIGVMR